MRIGIILAIAGSIAAAAGIAAPAEARDHGVRDHRGWHHGERHGWNGGYHRGWRGNYWQRSHGYHRGYARGYYGRHHRPHYG